MLLLESAVELWVGLGVELVVGLVEVLVGVRVLVGGESSVLNGVVGSGVEVLIEVRALVGCKSSVLVDVPVVVATVADGPVATEAGPV